MPAFDIFHQKREDAPGTLSGYVLTGWRWVARVHSPRKLHVWRAYSDRYPAPEGWTMSVREAPEWKILQLWLAEGGQAFRGPACDHFDGLTYAADTTDVLAARGALGVLADLAEEHGVLPGPVARTRALLALPSVMESILAAPD